MALPYYMRSADLRPSAEIWRDLVAEHGEIVGDLQFFTTHIYNEGHTAEFIDMLNEPAPDWQRDC
jgi:hypothetical protein